MGVTISRFFLLLLFCFCCWYLPLPEKLLQEKLFVVLNIFSLEDVEVALKRVEEYALDVNDDDGFDDDADDEATTKVLIVEGVPVVVVNIIIFTVVKKRNRS